MTSVAVDPTNPSTVFAGTAGGGVWKSTNKGAAWSPLTDTQQSLAIGSLAIDPSGQIIYAGTGEDNGPCGDCQDSNGILKSTDGGSTWTVLNPNLVFSQSGERIGGLAIDRTSSGTTQHVFAATNKGLYESTDAGTSWAQVMFNGVIGRTMQIIQDPSNASIFWAALSNFCGVAGQVGVTGQIQISRDSGQNWNPVFTADTTVSRIALGVGSSGVAYAALADCQSDGSTVKGDLINVIKTSDYGATQPWATVNNVPNYFDLDGNNPQGWYDNVVAVDPTTNSNVVLAGVTVLTSTNGGSSFTDVGKIGPPTEGAGGFIHPDFHAVTFSGTPSSFYIGNDGGMWSTADMGGSGATQDWSNLNSTLATLQLYAGTALDSGQFIAGAQDNGTSGHFSGSANSLPTWDAFIGGDGGDTAVVPGTTTVYTEYPFLGIQQGDESKPYGSWVNASPCSVGTDPACYEIINRTVAFEPAPFLLDPTNGKHMLAATSRVYESTTGGLPAGAQGWSPISGYLTNPAYPGDYINAMAMGQTPATIGTVFTGSRVGAVYVTTNDGATPWTPISGPWPDRSPISSIAINPRNTAEVWLTIDSTATPYVWHTVNATCGTNCVTWTPVSGTDASGTSVVVDPFDSAIYVGTRAGVRTCSNCFGSLASAGSANWSNLGSGLPNVWVASVSLTQDCTDHLVAWTHGRGAWVLDVMPRASWLQRFPATSPLPARWRASMAYDGSHHRLVMFGGTTTTSGGLTAGALNDTWTFDGCNWTKQPQQSNPPPARLDAGMAYDSATGQVVLFGGAGPSNPSPGLTDTWTWNGSIWSQQHPTNVPPAATGASLAYDAARSRVVLYEVPSGQKGTPLGQTWTWDGSNWTKQNLANPAIPPYRYGPGMSYDSGNNVVVLFGGWQLGKGGAITYLNDTWLWNGSAWNPASVSTSPPGRTLMGMAFDAALGVPGVINGVTVMTMGCCNGGSLWSDVWGLGGSNWTQQNPTAVSPIRQGFVMTYYPPTGNLILYGGSGPNSALLSDTWSY